MANSDAWALGSEIASKNIAARRERKDKLEDEQRQQKVTDLYGRGKSLALSIKSMASDDPARKKAMDDLTSVEQDIASIYHPDNGGTFKLQRDWNLLAGLIHKSRPIPAAAGASFTATTSPGATFTPDAQTLTLSETPGYQGAAGTDPWSTPDSWLDASTSAASLSAVPKITKQPGTPASLPITLPSAPVTIPKTTTGQIRSLAAMTPAERQQYQRREQARTTAEQDVEAAGLTPEQSAQADAAQKMAYVRQAVKDYATINPQATSQQKASFLADVVEKTYGIAAKPVWKEFVNDEGQKEWLDVTQPVPAGWTATGTESADTRTRSDFAAYLKTHPDYKGTIQQWKVEQGQLGKLAVPTNRDDRYIAIQQKAALGQPLSKDEQAYADGYDMYVKKRVTGPMLARVEAQANDRIIPVIGQDPNDPGKVTLMPAGAAAKAGVGTPASIGFQTDKAMSKYMTSGKGGENLAAFDTAVSHLKLLGDTVEALNNGDIPLANRFGNAAGVEMGDDAVTNFNTVKNAVAGEIAKVFTNRGATGEEIALLNQTINSSQSNEQLTGAINYYIDLMGGKLGALHTQFESAQQPGGVEAALEAARAAAEAARKKVGGGAAAGAGATGGGAAGGVWTAPPGAPDASQFPEGHELYNKRTEKVEAVVRGGKWTQP
jgi:hypothetical protein